MIGPGGLLIGGALVVLLFGTKRLPELGSGLGEAISNFKKAVGQNNEPPRIDDNRRVDGPRKDDSDRNH